MYTESWSAEFGLENRDGGEKRASPVVAGPAIFVLSPKKKKKKKVLHLRVCNHAGLPREPVKIPRRLHHAAAKGCPSHSPPRFLLRCGSSFGLGGPSWDRLTFAQLHFKGDKPSLIWASPVLGLVLVVAPVLIVVSFPTPMSSPARSTVSAASGGAVSGSEAEVADSIEALYRKDEAMAELKSEVMEALQKEVRSLDDDSWIFAAPRSRINLVSRPGGYLPKQQGRLAEPVQASKKTRNF